MFKEAGNCRCFYLYVWLGNSNSRMLQEAKNVSIQAIQRKRSFAGDDEQGDEEKPASNSDDDVRLYCLAYMKDVWHALGQAASSHGGRKSLCIIADAGDVAGQSIELYFAYSPVAHCGYMLPHQAGPSLPAMHSNPYYYLQINTDHLTGGFCKH